MSGLPGLAMGEGGGSEYGYKRATWRILVMRIITCFDCDYGYANLHMW